MERKIELTHILTTGTVVFDVWEAEESQSMIGSTHSTVSWDEDGTLFGRLGTNRLPQELEALPAFSDERSEAVRKWQKALYHEAYVLIWDNFPMIQDRPEAFYHMGDVSIVFPSPEEARAFVDKVGASHRI